MNCRIHVRRKSVAQIRIEIGEAGAVDNQVERFREPRLRCLLQTQARLADVALHNFNLLLQKCA